MNKANARRRCDAVGRRRKLHEKDRETLQEETRRAVESAKLAGIAMEEVAARVGLTRTTIYQVYLNGGRNVSAAAGEATQATG